MKALVLSFFIMVLSFSLFFNSHTYEEPNDKPLKLEETVGVGFDTTLIENTQYILFGQLDDACIISTIRFSEQLFGDKKE